MSPDDARPIEHNVFLNVPFDKGYEPLFKPRGIFERLSWRTKDAYILRINDEYAEKKWDGYCTKEEAAQWLKGYSIQIDENAISGPDWHSASWLHVDELEKVKQAYENIGFYEQSWFQMRSPEQQPIPPNATAQKMISIIGTPEWYKN